MKRLLLLLSTPSFAVVTATDDADAVQCPTYSRYDVTSQTCVAQDIQPLSQNCKLVLILLFGTLALRIFKILDDFDEVEENA